MVHTATEKYTEPQFVNDFGQLKPISEFRQSNPSLACQMVGHRWPDGNEFDSNGFTIMEVQRKGALPFHKDDVVVGSYKSTKRYSLVGDKDDFGVPYSRARVPRIFEVIDQKTFQPSGTPGPYTWAKVIVHVTGEILDPEAESAMRYSKSRMAKQEMEDEEE